MYRRVIIKLSGEALGLPGVPFHSVQFDRVAEAIKTVAETVQIGILTGGGNLWRGRKNDCPAMDPVTSDHIGMTATLMNSLYLKDALHRTGVKAEVFSAVPVNGVCQPYTRDAASAYMDAGGVALFAFGSGLPFFTTDTAVALRAAELGADAIFMAKNTGGVYTADPNRDDTARLIPDITYQQCIELQLEVMDMTAFQICIQNHIPLIRVFGLKEPDNIRKVLNGDPMGSFVHP
ncbi:MAG: uridine monophosphate kinase [Clostridia bacterium]|nr:uridine monophosphate kinase [Clostridia bacterium]